MGSPVNVPETFFVVGAAVVFVADGVGLAVAELVAAGDAVELVVAAGFGAVVLVGAGVALLVVAAAVVAFVAPVEPGRVVPPPSAREDDEVS